MKDIKLEEVVAHATAEAERIIASTAAVREAFAAPRQAPATATATETEEQLLKEIFDENKKWKQYPLDWCSLCDVASIKCPVCGHGSCSGGGCIECSKDSAEWSAIKRTVSQYLTQQEYVGYRKGLELQRLIVESIARGETEIDWRGLVQRGELSNLTQGWFQGLIDKQK